MKKKVGVVGSDGDIESKVIEMAELVGRGIAEAGCVLVCGGRGGVMEAACRGANEAGGFTLGVLPGRDTEGVNEYVDAGLQTGLGLARNSVIALASDVLIALHGSTGTLSEISMALNYGKPVVCVKGSGGVTDKVKAAFPDDERIKRIVEADAADAVSEALKLI